MLTAHASAWLNIFLPGADSRHRLAEALADGASPWERMAFIRGRSNPISLTLMEAVLASGDVLSRTEIDKRLSLLSRYASASTSAPQDRALERVVIQMMTQGSSPAAAGEWTRLAFLPPRLSARLLSPVLAHALDTGGEKGAGWMAWAHESLKPAKSWPPLWLERAEGATDPALRDAYWELRRHPSASASASTLVSGLPPPRLG